MALDNPLGIDRLPIVKKTINLIVLPRVIVLILSTVGIAIKEKYSLVSIILYYRQLVISILSFIKLSIVTILLTLSM